MKLSDLQTFVAGLVGHVLAIIVVVFSLVFIWKDIRPAEFLAMCSFIVGIYLPSPIQVGQILKEKERDRHVELTIDPSAP